MKKLYDPAAQLKCLDCGNVFDPNYRGESETGVRRPQCTNQRCLEEIDVVQANEDDDE